MISDDIKLELTKQFLYQSSQSCKQWAVHRIRRAPEKLGKKRKRKDLQCSNIKIVLFII
ncbi:hypothetical protein QUC31_015710 [Theobroma cacao]